MFEERESENWKREQPIERAKEGMEKTWRMIILLSPMHEQRLLLFSLPSWLERVCARIRERESTAARERARRTRKLEGTKGSPNRGPPSPLPSRTSLLLLLLSSRRTAAAAAAAGHPSRRQRADVAQAPLRLAEEHGFSGGAFEQRKRALDLQKEQSGSECFVREERKSFFFLSSVDLLPSFDDWTPPLGRTSPFIISTATFLVIAKERDREIR